MTDFPNRIIQILRGCPNGLTSKDIAERLGTTRRNLSSRLSKLAAYGIIGRARGTVAEHGTKGAIYRAPCDAAQGRCIRLRKSKSAQNIVVDCTIPYGSTGVAWGFLGQRCHASGTQRISSCRSAHGGVAGRVCNAGRSPRRGTSSRPGPLGIFQGHVRIERHDPGVDDPVGIPKEAANSPGPTNRRSVGAAGSLIGRARV